MSIFTVIGFLQSYSISFFLLMSLSFLFKVY